MKNCYWSHWQDGMNEIQLQKNENESKNEKQFSKKESVFHFSIHFHFSEAVFRSFHLASGSNNSFSFFFVLKATSRRSSWT